MLRRVETFCLKTVEMNDAFQLKQSFLIQYIFGKTFAAEIKIFFLRRLIHEV